MSLSLSIKRAKIWLLIVITCLLLTIILFIDMNFTPSDSNKNQKEIMPTYDLPSNLSLTRSTHLPQELSMWSSTPKIIWICWFQGWINNKTTPLLQQLVYKSWKYHNKKDGWSIILLDNENIPKYMNSSKWYYYKNRTEHGDMGYAGLSNIVRMELLSTFGGVWVDATVFCMKPLNEWLPEYNNDIGFFLFRRRRAEVIISTWFIFANNGSYMINRWNEQIQTYWMEHDIMHTYHWVHAIFQNLTIDNASNSDHKFGVQWSKVPKYNADEPHFISDHIESRTGPMEVGINDNKKIKKHMDKRKSPMYKLPHELNEKYKKIGNYSVLDYLVNTIPYEDINGPFEHRNNLTLVV